MKRAYKWVAFAVCFALIMLMGVKVVPLQDRAIVVGLAIDADDEGYSVAAQILMPSDDDSKSSGYIISEARSETLSGALTKISEQSNLIVAMSHCNLVILGKGVIDRGAYYSLDYLVRNAYLSENALLLAAEGSAADILSAKTAYSETSSFYIQRALMEFGYFNDRTVRTIREFIVSHYTYNKANWLPVVTKRVAQSEENPGTSGGGTESPEGGGDEQYVFDFRATAIFRDGKYRFTLSEEGTAGLAYVNSVIEEGSVTVTDSSSGEIYNCYIVRSSAKKSFDPRSLTATVEVKIKLILKEVLSESDTYAPEDVEPSDGVSALISEKIVSDITEAFERCRAEGVDIFDIYGGFYGKGGAEWRDNGAENYLGRAKLEVKTEITFH